MQLILIKEGQQIDVTAYSGSYSRSDNTDSLGMEFGFELALNPNDKYWAKTRPAPGDKLLFANNDKPVFEGIITDEIIHDQYTYAYTAYDFGFYLNKSEVIAQFNGLAGDAAITKLCGQLGIPIGSITSIPTSIKQIYNGQVLSECIKDILQQATDDTGRKFRLEVRNNKLYIEDYADLVVKAMYQPASNIAPFDVTLAPGKLSGSQSMADMRNIVVVASSKEKSISIQATAQDDASIAKYGLLQKVEKVDDKNKAQAKNIAANKLAELNKITKKINLHLMGDDAVRAGRILEFNQPDIDMTGRYLVKNCTHNYSNNNHTMQVELEAVSSG